MKVLLVDTHPTMRLGVRAILEREEDVDLVEEAESLKGALEICEDHDPDVVVLDLDLKGEGSGTKLCGEIKARPEPPRVVVHTARGSEEDAFLSLRLSGADSYVHKSEEPTKLLETIRETHAGRKVWLLGDGESSANGGTAPESGVLSLTPREKEVLGLLIKRHTNSEISAELSISLQTVKNHVSNILKKFGVSSRTELL